MPRISDEHRALMTQRIETAALECARQKGIGAMSMSDVIRESGLSAGAIYGYYSGKDELLAAMARRVVGNRAALLDEFAERNPVPHPAEGVLEFMDVASESLAGSGLALQIWALAANSDVIGGIARESYAQLIAHMGSYLTAWLAEQDEFGVEEATQRGQQLAPAMIALVQGWLFKLAVVGNDDDGSYFSSVEELLRKP